MTQDNKQKCTYIWWW